jgi:hypothetical protein
MRHRVVVALVVFVAATFAFPVRAAHADDASGRWVLQDDQGLLTTDFGSSQTVYVTGEPKDVGGIIPAADVYVVPNQDWSHSDGQVLHDVSNPSGTPNTVVGFEVVQQPIYLPYLAVGQYDVVFDYDQDGVYNASVDDVLGIDSGPGFTVHYDGNSRSIDKTKLKNDLAAPIVTAATTASALYSDIQFANRTSNVLDLASNIGTLVTDSPSPALVDLDLATDGQWQKFNPDPSAHDIDVGTAGLAKAAKDLQNSAAGIQADPPDPNYKQVAVAQLPSYTYNENSTDPLASAFAAVANRAGEAAAYQLALRHAMERLDGAAAANDLPWVKLQGEAIATNSNALVNEYPRLQTALDNANSVINNLGLSLSLSTAEQSLFSTMQARVAAHGFDATELARFASAGMTSQQIARFQSWITSENTTDLATNGGADLSSLSGVAPNAQDAAFDGATQGNNLVGSLPVLSPIASAGPAQTVTGSKTVSTHVTLDAGGSQDPQQQPLTYLWSQVSGPAVSFDDHTKVKPVITVQPCGNGTGHITCPATLTIRVTVTNTSHLSTSATTTVTVKAPK